MNPKPLDLEAIAIFAPDEEPIGSRILYVNDAFVRMSGYLAEQLVGHSALLLAGARPDPEAMRRAVSAPSDRPYVARERRRRPDGSTYEALVRLEPLPMAMSSSTARPARMVLTMRMLESSR